jgi:hypothetical protein
MELPRSRYPWSKRIAKRRGWISPLCALVTITGPSGLGKDDVLERRRAARRIKGEAVPYPEPRRLPVKDFVLGE